MPRLEARDLVFSGTSATGGEATGVVYATGMSTELGRIAALSERVKERAEPTRGTGAPGRLADRGGRASAWRSRSCRSRSSPPACRFGSSVVFAVGLLAGNVPEGLLPVITLALAVAVGAARATRRARQATERRRDAGLAPT